MSTETEIGAENNNTKIKIMASKINADWHGKNKMPKNPSLDERVAWRLEHARNCRCRPLEGKILAEIKRRGLKV